ncbi:MAG: TIGR02147 family protein, partial [Proteobacteria bacterium]
MEIFDSPDVQSFLNRRLTSLPKNGHGELRRMAKATGIHTTTMSQIYKGDRALSLEQAHDIAEDLGLSPLEKKYLLALVHRERAGTQKLRSFFEDELKELREGRDRISMVVKKDKTLTADERAQFYSNWYYAGIAVLSSIPKLQTVEALATHTGLTKTRLKEAIEFLVKSGISVSKNGRLSHGTKSTHLESSSPLIARHHGNWRVKAMEKHPNLSEDEVAYSSPMSLSEQDAKRIRKMIVAFVKEVAAIRDPSPCEEAYCLNI